MLSERAVEDGKMIEVTINWQRVDEGDSSGLWNVSRGLYSYLNLDAGDEEEILYVGKVDGTTVRKRWCRSGKEGFWGSLETERGIYSHGVIVGLIGLPARRRLSRELITDVESLLINRLCPWGNIQCRLSRTSRPGLTVRCVGDWPLGQHIYVDD